MKLRFSARWIAAALAMVPLPALAAPGPANSIDCVYEALTVEDREIALVLVFVRHSESGEDRASWLRGIEVAGRMLDAAKAQCRAAHRWSRAQAALAREYAFDTLMAEGMRQILELEGTRSVEPIDRYFARHADKLIRGQDPASKQGKAFTAYLIEQGWDAEGETELRQARRYLDALIERHSGKRWFVANPRS